MLLDLIDFIMAVYIYRYLSIIVYMISERMDKKYMDNSMEMISSMVVCRCHMKICGLQMEVFLPQMTFVQLVKMKIFLIITTILSF